MCRSKWSLRRHTAVPACLLSRPRLPSSRARGWNTAICRHCQGMESSGEVRHLQRSICESLNLDRLQMIRKTVLIRKRRSQMWATRIDNRPILGDISKILLDYVSITGIKQQKLHRRSEMNNLFLMLYSSNWKEVCLSLIQTWLPWQTGIEGGFLVSFALHMWSHLLQ